MEQCFRDEWVGSRACARAAEEYGTVAGLAFSTSSAQSMARSLHYPRENLRPRLKRLGVDLEGYYLLYIMTNDTEEHVNKVIEDKKYWQDIRNFFDGGLDFMRQHPRWFLLEITDVPRDFDTHFLPPEINGYLEEEQYAMSRFST